MNVYHKILLLVPVIILSINSGSILYAQDYEQDNISVYLIKQDKIIPVVYNEIDVIPPDYAFIQDTLEENGILIAVKQEIFEDPQFAFQINNEDWISVDEDPYFLLNAKHLNLVQIGLKINEGVTGPETTYFFTGPFNEQDQLKAIHFVTGILVLILLFVLFFFFRFYRKRDLLEHVLNEKTNELLSEREKTEKLLSNLLPKGTAEELRTKGRADSKKYDMATVLFCDIQGFTKIAEEMNPEILVDKLDSFFFHFDLVVEKLNIEKIKTIGDAYMCAGGIPKKNTTNPVEVVLAALEMMDYMINLQENKGIWELRMGVHTGSVIAGVVGQKRLSYDIWGDTVNTASRMESSGEAGKVNISGQTYRLIKDYFICEYRGKMPVKYKGKIDMYFVKRIRPDLSEKNIYKPNQKFLIKLQLLRLHDLESEVYSILEEFQDLNLPYHNLKHTIDLYTKAELYAIAESLPEEETLLVKTAGLLYDLYILHQYKYIEKENHVVTYLMNEFKYSEKQKEIVFRLFLRLEKPLIPQSEMEKVFVDAEYDYFGRSDFKNILKKKFKEMSLHNPVNGLSTSKKDIEEMFEFYDFHTATAKKLREVKKLEQMYALKEVLEEIK